jgi:hypothetical protein
LSRRGCLTLYAIDGILEWRNAWENRPDEPACPWTMRPVLSHKVACIGASQARVLDSWGNRGKTEMVGIPRLDGYATANRQSRPAGDRWRVLVTTAKWPAFTPQQLQQITGSLQDLKKTCQASPRLHDRRIEVVWRLTGDLHRKLAVENQLHDLGGQELCEILANVDAVITTPSTVMLEAMLAGVPVCLLDYTNSPRYVDAAWSISAPSQIRPVLEQLAAPSSQRLYLQQSILQDALQCRQSATHRMIRLIQEMIRIGHDCRAAGRPLEFPFRILPDPDAEEAWDQQAMFPERPAIPAGDNLDECLAVASEALRRADVLEPRVERLQRELEQAAEEFARISRHPVFGRLARVREIADRMSQHISRVLAREHKRNPDEVAIPLSGAAGETAASASGSLPEKS